MQNNRIHVAIVKADCSVWLCNSTDEDITLHAGELSGYGLGSCSEVATGWMLDIHRNLQV